MDRADVLASEPINYAPLSTQLQVLSTSSRQYQNWVNNCGHFMQEKITVMSVAIFLQDSQSSLTKVSVYIHDLI